MTQYRKEKKMEYLYRREGEIVEVKIKDQTRRVIYKTKFNIGDKNAILKFLGILEKYSGFSVYQLVQEKLKVGDWW